MTTTTFVDGSTTVVASWLNDVNTATYTTVPALTAGVQPGTLFYATSVAGTNTITATLTGVASYGSGGLTVRLVAAGANTGAVTFDLNGLGAKSVTKSGTTALVLGDIVAGAAYTLIYDGTRFQISGGTSSGGGATGGGTDAIFYQNSTTMTSSYTLTTGKNALMAGPLTVGSGLTLTIPSGQRLVVL